MAMLPHVSSATQSGPTRISNNAMPTLNSVFPQAVIQTLKQRHWLELAEYFSLATSAIGSLVVALSGQAFYGVAPLTVALSFNVANRYRLEQQTQQTQVEIAHVFQSMEQLEKNAVKVVVGLRQQILSEIQTLQQQLESLPSSGTADTASQTEQIEALQNALASLQDHLTTALQEIRQQVHQELQTLSPVEWVNLQPFEATLRELQALTSELRDQAVTQTELKPIQETLATLQQSSNLDLSEIQAQLDQLKQENQDVIKPHIKRLLTLVRQLQKTDTKTLPLPPKPLPKKLSD